MIFARYKLGHKPSYKPWTEIRTKAFQEFNNKLESQRYQFESAPCPVCSSQSIFFKLSEIDSHGILSPVAICKKCGLIQTIQRLNEKSLNEFYNTEYLPLYKGIETPDKDWFMTQHNRGKQIYNFLQEKNALPEKNSKLVLEVGCGTGGALKFFKEMGWQEMGVDLSEDQVRMGREKENLNLVVGSTENLKISKAPDLIIINHVLEHFLDPLKEAKAIANLMDENTVLFVGVPGIKNGRDFLKMLKNCHIYHFSLTTLSNLLEKVGLELIHGNETINAIFKKTKTTGAKHKIKNDYLPFMSMFVLNEMIIKLKKGLAPK